MNELAAFISRHEELSKAKEKAQVLGEGMEGVDADIEQVVKELRVKLYRELKQQIPELLPPLCFDPQQQPKLSIEDTLHDLLDLLAIEESEESLFVIPLDGKDDFHLYLANYYYLADDISQASSLYENLLEESRDDNYLYNLSVIRAGQKIYSSSLELMEELDPASYGWKLPNNRGYVYDKLGRKEKALSNYADASELSETSYTILINTAMTLKHFGDPAAITALENIITEFDSNAFALSELGDIYAKQGKYEEALRQYQLAADEDPSNDILYDLSTLLMINEQFDGAIGLLSRLVEKESSSRVHNNLGVALMKKDEFEEAKVHLQKALEIDPDYSRAKANLEKLTSVLEDTD